MDYVSWTAALLEEIPKLWPCLLDNLYPTTFLTRVFFLSPEAAARLPRYLLAYTSVYLLCGVITLVLHCRKGQRSLNSPADQINNVILSVADFLFIPMLFALWTMGKESLSTVAPYTGEISDLWRFFSDYWTALFFPLLVFSVTLLTVLFPFHSALRYLKVYKLPGVPHMIFDVGTGVFLISDLLLAAAYETRLIYLLIALAFGMLFAIQRGGYIPNSRNARLAMEEREKPSSKE